MSGVKRIRVGLVAPTMDILGGHAVQADRMLEAWRCDREIEMRLLPINPKPGRAVAGLSRIRFLRTVLTQLRYWPLLAREVPRVDAVHVFCPSNSSFYLSALPAILVARLNGKPVIANHRGDDAGVLASSAPVRRLLASATVNVAPSSYACDIARAAGIGARIIPNFCDLTRFQYRVRDPIRPRLISTRNLERIYNVACTLRAFAVIQARFPDASLVLVGDGSAKPALLALVRGLGVRHVTFAGAVPNSEIPRLYDSADIYVQTPLVDNMPGSLVEAFACGLPVVATDVGGVPAMLEHGIHGLLAPSNDHDRIAANVFAMLDRPSDARRMAEAAFATCERYTWSTVGEQWRNVYRTATGMTLPPALPDGDA